MARRKLLHVDFETRAVVELGGSDGVGLYNYATHPQTEVLMLAWAIDDSEVELWIPNPTAKDLGMPQKLREALHDPEIDIVAFNSAFERFIFQYKLGITLPASRFQDPQASARYLSLPANLDDVCTILGLPPELAKDKEGKRLIKVFCNPTKAKKKRGEEERWYFRDKMTDPEDWARFCDYCVRDVKAEREVLRRLGLLQVWPLPPKEREIWIMDQEINDRGLPVDAFFVRQALALGTKAKNDAIEILNKLTGLENANSNSQMLEWVKTQGYEPDSLDKKLVQAELEYNDKLTPLCREVLTKRKTAASTTYKKLVTMLRLMCPDRKIRHLFSYMGSARCGRWSSNSLQFHNMARPSEIFEDTETLNWARSMIYAGDYDAIEMWFGKPTETEKDPGSVLSTIKSCIRTVFVAPLEEEFCVADENAIETRVAAWISQCGPLLDVFKTYLCLKHPFNQRKEKFNCPECGAKAVTKDPYLDFAVKMTQIPYETLAIDLKSSDPIRKATAKKHRQIAKPGVLGCFGENSLILTDSGWKKIIDVKKEDLLFDGEEFVTHGGVVYQGIKRVINFYGVEVTPDHKILVGKNWRETWDIHQNFLYAKQAIKSAIGSSLKVFIKKTGTIMFVYAKDAIKNMMCLNKTWSAGELLCVIRALYKKYMTSVRLFIKCSMFPETPLINWQIAITPLLADVKAEGTGGTGMEDEEYSAISNPFTSLWNIRSRCRTTINQNMKSTELIMTGITKKEICGLFLESSIVEIKKQIALLNIMEKFIALPIFGKSSQQDIEKSEMSRELYERVLPQSKSSPIKQGAEVPTYDILNSGPRNRYLIKTDIGPMIAHNCVYRLSGGDIFMKKSARDIFLKRKGVPVKGGLWGYAENYGVKMSRDSAHEVVRVFRESYKEICQFWYKIEVLVKEVLEGERIVRYCGPNDCIKIDKITIGGRDPLLRIQLPSGRYLHYLDASVRETKMPWQTEDEEGELVDVYKPTLVYSGQSQQSKQWVTITSHGGRLCENLSQAIARDVLAEAMLVQHKKGMRLVAHVHDEQIALKDKNDPFAFGFRDMERDMEQSVDWAKDLPLKGEGFNSKFYRK